MSTEVELLVQMAETLDEEKVGKIAEAYRAAGHPHTMFSMVAAKQAGRHDQACDAMRDVVMNVTIISIVNDYDPLDVDRVLWAGRNAAYAVATEDLIGSFAYSTREYGNLVDPWFAGFHEREGDR